MFSAPRNLLVLAAALVVSMLLFVPESATAGCKNAGGSVGARKYSSQVNGQAVSICSAAIAVTPARTAVVIKKVQVAAPAKPIARVSPAQLARLKQLGFTETAKPKVVKLAKPKVKTLKKVIKKSGTTTSTNGVIDFTPATPGIRVSPSHNLTLGQSATFSSTVGVHHRSGLLNRVPTEVRFTPVGYRWDMDDGADFTAAAAQHSFGSSGEYAVTLSVRFAIAYRVRGGVSWIADPDQIEMTSQKQITVSDADQSASTEPAAEANNRVLLVGETCLAKPGTFGCG